MGYDNEKINDIFERTDGKCHICNKTLSFSNYGRPGRKGAWEVEHSNPKAKGGTNHLNNLYPACISCNRVKGTYTSRTARSWHGRRWAPLSAKRKEEDFRKKLFWGAILVGGYFLLKTKKDTSINSVPSLQSHRNMNGSIPLQPLSETRFPSRIFCSHLPCERIS